MAERREPGTFDRWERAVATHLDDWLRDPRLLEPAAQVLALVTKTKTRIDALRDRGIGALGLATRRDHERTLFALRELEHQVRTLNERIDTLRD